MSGDPKLNPSGILIGGKNARFQRVHGDIVASYQYVNGERAMALWPREKKLKPGAFIVCDSAAWRYSPDHPKTDWYAKDRRGTLLTPLKLVCGPLYLMMMAEQAAFVMGMDNTKPTIIRIATIIAEGLQDLVRLPPERPEDDPNFGRKPIGTASLIIGGEKIAEREI